MLENGAQHRDVGVQAGDVKLVERAARTFHGGCEGSAGGGGADHLGQQGVELRRRCVAEITGRIDPHARAGGLLVGADGAGAIGVHPCLNGVQPGRGDDRLVAHAEAVERRARRDPELGLHEVEPRDLLGDRVLHLDAGIALDEVVLARLRRHQELDGSGIDVVRGAGELHRVGMQPGAHPIVEIRCRCRLDELLVAQLHRTVALEQVHDLALRVREDLNFDMPGAWYEFLHEQ